SPMSDLKISAMTPAAALTGTEEVPAIQGGFNVKTTTQDIADLFAGAGLGPHWVTPGSDWLRWEALDAVPCYVQLTYQGILTAGFEINSQLNAFNAGVLFWWMVWVAGNTTENVYNGSRRSINLGTTGSQTYWDDSTNSMVEV